MRTVTELRPAPTRWKMPWATAGILLVVLLGLGILTYPSAASWVSQYNQSKLIEDLDAIVEEGPASRMQLELDRARQYNQALIGGALLSPESNVPTSEAGRAIQLDYFDILALSGDSAMGRLRIDAIALDLPIYHGTSDATLAKGVGHLQGTSLPIGGESQHSVLTAHRGLPEATLFDNLNKMKRGETFTIEIFGEVLTYRVIETQTVLPDETQALYPVYGKDLVTLVTCTPLGVNSHRYLVTGERITPTPLEDIEKAGNRPEIPGFPWWAAWSVIGVAAIGFYWWRSGLALHVSKMNTYE